MQESIRARNRFSPLRYAFILSAALCLLLLGILLAERHLPPVRNIAADDGNVGVVDIPDLSPYKQVVALSDVHGMSDNLRHLLVAASLIDTADRWIADPTLLLVVGDSIDKGPHSLEVLDLWMALSAQAAQKGSRIVVLLGNHEAEFLADPTNKKAAAFRADLKAQGLNINEVVDPARPRARFLLAMPLAARVGNRWLFCHAGWIPAMSWNDFVSRAKTTLRAGNYASDFLIGPDSILEKRADRNGDKWWENEAEVKDLEDRLTGDGLYGVVFGHQPEAFGLTGAIGPYSAKDDRLIKIDSGMAPDAGGYPGHLLLFTAPQELTQNQKPAHVFSVGFESEGKPLKRDKL